MRIRKLTLGWVAIYAKSTTQIFYPETEWMDANDFTRIRVTHDNRAFIAGLGQQEDPAGDG